MRPVKRAVLAMVLSGLMCAITPTQTSEKPASQPPSWLGWGGPMSNFTSDSKGLANTWPAAGPKRLWSRALGEGHSSIVGEGARLYTMYRPPTGVRNSWKAEEVI